MFIWIFLPYLVYLISFLCVFIFNCQLAMCWGTNFRVLISLAHSLKKIPTQAHKLFWAHINISHILLKYSPWCWAPTNIPYISPVDYLRPSHKYYPLYPTYYPTYAFHKNTYHIATKLGHKIILSSQKSPKSFALWEKSKNPNKTLLKAHCYTAPLKVIATRHL